MKNQFVPKRVAITGANGKVGKVIISQLDPSKFIVTPHGLPDHDVRDLNDLTKAVKGMDVLIHLAWKNLSELTWNHLLDPDNNLMTYNAYKAAVKSGVKRVIMASSHHIHRASLPDNDGRIHPWTNPLVPTSPYGAEKVFMEGLGRYFAVEHGLEVISIRIGNSNPENKPKPSSPEQPQRWISHRDLGRLITLCIEADKVPGNFQIVYGVSKQPTFDWSNPFGYEPQDSAE